MCGQPQNAMGWGLGHRKLKTLWQCVFILYMKFMHCDQALSLLKNKKYIKIYAAQLQKMWEKQRFISVMFRLQVVQYYLQESKTSSILTMIFDKMDVPPWTVSNLNHLMIFPSNIYFSTSTLFLWLLTWKKNAPNRGQSCFLLFRYTSKYPVHSPNICTKSKCFMNVLKNTTNKYGLQNRVALFPTWILPYGNTDTCTVSRKIFFFENSRWQVTPWSSSVLYLGEKALLWPLFCSFWCKPYENNHAMKKKNLC